ncbi:MAG TPA: hypothetical protein VF647_12635 [Longimicrobium sp.]
MAIPETVEGDRLHIEEPQHPVPPVGKWLKEFRCAEFYAVLYVPNGGYKFYTGANTAKSWAV